MTRSSREAGFTMPELLTTTIIVMLTLGITTSALVQTQRGYAAQRERVETANQARAAMDAITRLVRMSGSNALSIPALLGPGLVGPSATVLRADPDGNNVYDSIGIQSDWNPTDGAIDDPYEDIVFSVVNGQLVKREPSDVAGPVLFAENVQGMTFTYRDTNENAIANPVASFADIAFVTIQIQTRSSAQVQDGAALTLASSVAVRRAE